MRRRSRNIDNKDSNSLKEDIGKYYLTKSLQENINLFKSDILKLDDTVIYREFKNKKGDLKFCLIFIDGMADREIINENIIWPLMKEDFNEQLNDMIDYVKEEVLIIDDVIKTNEVEDILKSFLYGDTLLLVDGFNEGLLLNTKGWQTRAIAEPPSETVVKGPREGFNESLNINMSLIRRKINSPNLKFQRKEIGVRTNTKICIIYMEGIVNTKILEELTNRLDKIDVEGVFGTGQIQEIISDNPLSPFKTIGNTERPDVIAAKLLQGRIAILCDGSPMAITLPYLFIEHFQINEDYYDNFIYASINRILRVVAFIITVATPGVYVAFIAFHKELIPTKLALSIYAAKQGVPLPTVIETLLMIIVFEIIREAGLRLPKHIGAAVSIVGALVLGDAAVNAKFVSAPIVIVTAIAGICELILYEMNSGIIISRFIFLILASLLGLYGVIFASMGLILHLMSIKSFGIPYMLNLIDLDKYNIRDAGIRAPCWLLKYRTKFIARDKVRSKNYINRRNRE
ncbi:spore germination protein [Clostridium algidicarnis]|uniref:spore germination protein n=1 Tax=Clostridium algidicarnis TaxID=37659 RepID=UPI001C0B0166|nr:spore germination protein [Clostridium algidicarnis]MBU3206768.1 spore germination protein [Clostridium algidicarnis]